ncbi:MAG: hypothetical protein WD396_01030 [Pseudohongiellaceae bacterium]
MAADRQQEDSIMDIEQLEEAARDAWPALQEYQGSTGVMRFAAGVSRRANSMTPVRAREFCPESLMREAEDFYGAFRLPAIVRVLEGPRTGLEDQVTRACLENGLMVTPTRGGIIRLLPSLLVSRAEIDTAIVELDRALAAAVPAPEIALDCSALQG